MGRGGTSAQEANVSGEQSSNCARGMPPHNGMAPGDRGSRPGGHRGPTCGRAQGSKRGKSTRGRLREFALRVVSHNAQSLRQPGAIEVAINHMHRHKIHTCAVQEAWWGGTGVLCNQDHTTLGANEGGTTRRDSRCSDSSTLMRASSVRMSAARRARSSRSRASSSAAAAVVAAAAARRHTHGRPWPPHGARARSGHGHRSDGRQWLGGGRQPSRR